MIIIKKVNYQTCWRKRQDCICQTFDNCHWKSDGVENAMRKGTMQFEKPRHCYLKTFFSDGPPIKDFNLFSNNWHAHKLIGCRSNVIRFWGLCGKGKEIWIYNMRDFWGKGIEIITYELFSILKIIKGETGFRIFYLFCYLLIQIFSH